METRNFLLGREDGSVATIQIIRQPDGRWPSVEECVAKWPEEHRTAVRSYRPYEVTEIPADRSFRNAWKDEGGKVVVDMPKAREIWREVLRTMRGPLLTALDVAYQRADEQNDAAAKADVARRKQALRDVTADPAIEAAQTPEELKQVIPAALRGE